jgi:nanoRNase/pAp phosphatase (c-di-AMP/oligoRNAs hydrolase)
MVCQTLVDGGKHFVSFDRLAIPSVNCPGMFASDIGNILAKSSPVGVGFTYCTEDGVNMKCSLRGTGQVDVSNLAKILGGGGHHNAAGFTIPVVEFFSTFV